MERLYRRAAAQAMGFRPERVAQISGEHWAMENVKKHFAEKRNDLYARSRLAKTEEERRKVIRDMQEIQHGGQKIPGWDPAHRRKFIAPGSFAKTGEAVYGVREDNGSKPVILM